MLKNIPACIAPELMKAMMCMGHGDELVIADADFPADTYGKKVIRADGIKTVELLQAILRFYPLDSFVEQPVILMGPENNAGIKELLERTSDIIRKVEPGFKGFGFVERFDFYDRAAKAYAIVVTSQEDGNIILKKGVVNN